MCLPTAYPFALLLIMMLAACAPATEPTKQLSQVQIEERLKSLSEFSLKRAQSLPIDSLNIPRSLNPDGSLHGTKSRSWTSGFYPGTLWQLYGFSKDQELMDLAQQWTAFVAKEQFDTHTHDLGFKIYCSFGQGLAYADKAQYEKIILQASRTLIQRYNPKIGAIRSWDFNRDRWQFPVIIDNMMNLEMLFEAEKLSQEENFAKIALQHAMTTYQNHFRDDHSSFHVVSYDTILAEPHIRQTHQGVADNSAWARGQAWGLYGFTLAYRYTQNKTFLAQAQQIAAFMFEHPNMPQDLIPYWDFDAPNIPHEIRDVSAAAVAASALIELSQFSGASFGERYLAWADKILVSLQQPKYQSSLGPFILAHSAGNVPDSSEVDVPIVYADYYYVEALLRRLELHTTKKEPSVKLSRY